MVTTLPPKFNVDYRYPQILFDGENTAFQCDTIGVAGTTPIYVKCIPLKRKDWPYKYELRMGIAIMGSVNDPDSSNKNPFDDNWRDNYVKATGCTIEMALKKLRDKIEDLQRGLFF